MKVMHLISGGDVGGAKTHVLSLVKGLGQTQTVRLVCFTDGPFADDARAMGIDTMILHENPFKTVRTLSAMIASEGFEIVHCHGARANMMGAILRRIRNVPIVTTVHSDYRLDYLGRPLHALTFGTINAVALRMFDYHIGVSDAMSQMLISRGFDPQSMFSIYNGVDFTPAPPKQTRQALLQSLGIDADEDTVIFGIAARISPVKDMGTLVRAFAQAVQDCPNIRLLIAGDGEDRESLEKLAQELCPAGTVAFAGWVSDMDSFYHALDVNTLTSISETFPYALTEGARMHCATIASDVGGIPYLIESGVTGLLFPPRDVSALAEHMKRLASDGAYRRQLGENLYLKASTDFSVEATVGRQIKIYESILRRKSRNRRERRGVLICGAYGKGNAGDEAILKAIIGQMKEIDEEMPVYVLSHHPKQTRLRYHVGSCHVFNPFAFLPLMRRCRLLLSGGGSLIQDETSTRSLLYYLLNIRLARAMGCRVMMYGCGIGPVSRKGNRRLAARIIDRDVDLITLREDLSRQELVEMGVTRPEIRITADPAVLLSGGTDGMIQSYLQSQELDPAAEYALFVLRPWKNLAQKLPVFAEAARYVQKVYGLTPLFFALEPGRDMAVNQQAAQMLDFPCRVIAAPADERLTIGLMKKMRVVVSMRLHTLIFASGVGTPLVAVSYDPKVDGFMRYIGQPRCASLEDVTEQALQALLDDALRSQETYSVEHLRALAHQNAEGARSLLEETP